MTKSNNTPFYTADGSTLRLAAYPELKFSFDCYTHPPMILFGTRNDSFVGLILDKPGEQITFIILHKLAPTENLFYLKEYNRIEADVDRIGLRSNYSDGEKYIYVYTHERRVPLDTYVERMNKLITLLGW